MAAGMAEGPEAQLVEKLRRIEALWPEFLELQSTLSDYSDALSDRAIEQAPEVKAGEAEEQNQSAPQLPPRDHQASLL